MATPQEAAMTKHSHPPRQNMGERDARQRSKSVQAAKFDRRETAPSEQQLDQLSPMGAIKRSRHRRLKLGEHFVATLKL
jgi:hypothetical protein